MHASSTVHVPVDRHARLKKLIIVMLLIGLTVSQLGCGCECATVATAIAIAGPVVMIGRELQEARKAELEIERLQQEREAREYHDRRSPMTRRLPKVVDERAESR